MTSYPNFSPNNYSKISELGRNNIGGRVTYLAQQITTKQQVVIKQFQFAVRGATWAEYDAYSQEIAMLQRLNHPGIPKYLDSFQTADGFCMVQEYINAQSLAVSRSWSPQEIKKVALAILEILVYLQSLNPSVIHRDLKPENILADKNLNIYLVDFGFARLGGGEIAASSVVKGTMGFMPPEQLFNRELTTASDLYGLGATLICLLTGIKSGSLGNLIDENYRIQFQHLVPPLKRGLISWLEKMSQSNPKDRYADAAEALEVLKSLDVERLPKVRVSRNNLEFVAEEFREKVTQTITISNPIPETVLTGRWEVAPHKNDPPHTPYDHGWIEFDSYQFEGNKVKCKITVDTSKLLAGESYHRELWLHSNSEGESLVITVEVKTKTLEKKDYETLMATELFLFFLLAIQGFTLVFPALEKILNVNTKRKKVNVFLTASFSVIFLGFLFFGILFLPSDFYRVFEELLTFITLFCVAIVADIAGQIGTNSRLDKGLNSLKNKPNLVWGLIIGFIILPPIVIFNNFFVFDYDLRIFLLITWFVYWPIGTFLYWCYVKSFVEFKNEKKLKLNAIKNNLKISGASMSAVLAFLLAAKFNFMVYTYEWNLKEKTFVVSIAIAPVLYFGLPLGKIIVKRWRAIARYNREKPNLIKP